MEQGNGSKASVRTSERDEQKHNIHAPKAPPAKPPYCRVWTEIRTLPTREGLQRMMGYTCLYQLQTPLVSARPRRTSHSRRFGPGGPSSGDWRGSARQQALGPGTDVRLGRRSCKGQRPAVERKPSPVKLQIFLRTVWLVVIQAPHPDPSAPCTSAEFGAADCPPGGTRLEQSGCQGQAAPRADTPLGADVAPKPIS